MRFRLTGTIGPVGAGSHAGIYFAVPDQYYSWQFRWQAGCDIYNYPDRLYYYSSPEDVYQVYTSCFTDESGVQYPQMSPRQTHVELGEVGEIEIEISVDVEIIGTHEEWYRTTLRAATPFGEVTQVVSDNIPPMFPFPTFYFSCSGPSASIGAVQIEHRATRRDYADWNDLRDFYFREKAPVVSGGKLISTQYSDGTASNLEWTPLLHGPVILQALAGYPVWRWRWQRNAATTTFDRHAAAVCERNGGDGVWEEQAAPWTIAAGQQTPTGLAAWMTDDGHAWTVSTLPYAGGAAAGTLQIFGPATGYPLGTSPLGAMSMGENGWDPVAARLWPSNDVLIVWIGANYYLAAKRCPYRVSTTTGAVSYVDDETETVSVGVQALATGGIWNDDTGRLYLSYLDLDGVTQLITSDDGGETWAAGE